MEVLFVCPYFHPVISIGGSTAASYSLSRALAKRNHDIVVFTSDARGMNARLNVASILTLDGIEVRYFKNSSSKSLSGLFITPGLISPLTEKLTEFDIVHLHEFRSFQNTIVCWYSPRIGVPYVLQAHGTLPMISQRRLSKTLFDLFTDNRILKNASVGIPLSRYETQKYTKLNS